MGPSQRRLKELSDKAETLLPAKMKQALQGRLKIKIEDLQKSLRGTMGHYDDAGIIFLDQSLFLISEPNQRQALATLLHESAHAYDRTHWNQGRPSRSSASPYFQAVSGFRGTKHTVLNYRSPDDYEKTDSQEFFAVNIEHFLLDPEYACRRPTMYRYLSLELQHRPFPQVTCTSNLAYVIPSYVDGKPPLRTMDLRRLYQVHYLLAGAGEGPISAFGHSMYRLVFCAPHRTSVGPECLQDINDHIVISFAAFVNDFRISSFGGMIGAYPSRLFFVPMSNIITEYTKSELRSLKSLPLSFSPVEAANFVKSAVEMHWSFEGDYYFLFKNCATESFFLLQSTLWKQNLVSLNPPKTPKGFEQWLYRKGLSTPEYMKNMSLAKSQGYFFESLESNYEKAYKVIKKNLNPPRRMTSLTRFFETSASYRSQLYHKMDRVAVTERQRTAAAILLLEGRFDYQLQKLKKARVDEILLSPNAGPGAPPTDLLKKAEELLGLIRAFSLPSGFLRGSNGYGLPLNQEITDVEEQSRHFQELSGIIFDQVETESKKLGVQSLEFENDIIQKNKIFALGFLN